MVSLVCHKAALLSKVGLRLHVDVVIIVVGARVDLLVLLFILHLAVFVLVVELRICILVSFH